MPNPESILFNKVRLLCSSLGARLFRNSVGFDDSRKIHYGLCKGSADGIGWISRKIKQSDVGKMIAVFLAVETKGTKRTKLSKEQKNFLEKVNEAGGIGIVAWNEQDVRDRLEGLDEESQDNI